MTAVGKLISKATSKRIAGFSAARLSPSTTSTVSRISMNLRGALSIRRPARSRIWTNGKDEPSMIGISGPSSSTTALSTPNHHHGGHQVLDGRDRDAGGVADHGAELGLADRLGGHRDMVVAIGDVGPYEDDAASAAAGRTATWV